MQWNVIPLRHLALFDFLRRLARFALNAIPFRKIQLLASIDHVAVQQPRDWRNVGIPGPLGLIAVAVEARARGEFARLRAVPFRFLNDWGICMRAPVWHELNRDKESRGGDHAGDQ